MPESILDSIKKLLDLDPSYTAFDQNITVLINGVFSTLEQMGVGPQGGFSISSNTETWDEYSSDENTVGMVRTVVFLRVKLLFDPPATSYLISAFERQAEQYEWRLTANRDMEVNPWTTA